MADNFFLGSFSPQGFKSDFSKVIDTEGYFTYILKGGAGTGKSLLMKKVGKFFEDSDEVSYYYCSSDPASLDGVVINNAKIVIVDGTSPHVFDPVYPGVRQKIINLGDCWDDKKLEDSTDEIILIAKEHKKLMDRTKRYVKALSSIFNDTYVVADEAVLTDKLKGFITRLTKKIAPKRTGNFGKVLNKQLSAITPSGYLTQVETFKEYEVYLLMDNFFAGSDHLLRELAGSLASHGKDVWVSLSNMFDTPVYEHLIVPDLKTAFISSNPLTGLALEGVKPINIQRFYDKHVISQRKYRLKLNKTACADLTAESSKTMKLALEAHNALESFYIKAMDFSKVDIITQTIIKKSKRGDLSE
ncbi:MAG: ATPase [Clostridiales bacterium]|nr:ATPase [Clostridiales bacterium]